MTQTDIAARSSTTGTAPSGSRDWDRIDQQVATAEKAVVGKIKFTGEMPGVVYVEGLVGRVYFDRPPDIARYRQVLTVCVL